MFKDAKVIWYPLKIDYFLKCPLPVKCQMSFLKLNNLICLQIKICMQEVGTEQQPNESDTGQP